MKSAKGGRCDGGELERIRRSFTPSVEAVEPRFLMSAGVCGDVSRVVVSNASSVSRILRPDAPVAVAGPTATEAPLIRLG
jgi:hypothetical protein